MTQADKYNNKVALVTGASSGIGKAFAETLHAQGAKVILVARRNDLLTMLVQGLNAKRENSAEILAVDLTVPLERDTVIAFIENNHIDILINNAGFGSFGFFEEQDALREQRMVILNCEVPLLLSHAVIPQLKERKSGAIINVSSIAGFQPLPFMATYAATKAFDLFFSIGLWAELRPFHIDVLAVCPGPTDTEFGGVARVPGTMTGIARDSTSVVVEESLRALERRAPFVVTGWRSKLMAFASRFLPLSLTTKILKRQLSKIL